MKNINFQSDDNQINDFLVVCDYLKQRPHRLVIHDSFTSEDFNKVINSTINIDDSYQNFFIEMVPSDDDYIKNQRTLKQISSDIFISFLEIDKNSEDSIASEIIFYFKNSQNIEVIENIILSLQDFIVDFGSSENHKINLLSVKENTLDLEPLSIDRNDSFDFYYNEEVISKINKLIKKIKKNETGISIIHGESGVGKTSVSKYICQELDEMCIYIPLNLVDQSINNPEFKNFLKKYGKVLLIIDDCEFFSNPLFGKSNFLSHNLIQLVDHVFSNICKINVLLIYNTTHEEDIDEVLVDSNFLIDILKIDELTINSANELSNHLGQKKKYKSPLRLIDVLKSQKSSSNFKIGLS